MKLAELIQVELGESSTHVHLPIIPGRWTKDGGLDGQKGMVPDVPLAVKHPVTPLTQPCSAPTETHKLVQSQGSDSALSYIAISNICAFIAMKQRKESADKNRAFFFKGALGLFVFF